MEKLIRINYDRKSLIDLEVASGYTENSLCGTSICQIAPGLDFSQLCYRDEVITM